MSDWNFKYNTGRKRWEAYLSPSQWDGQLLMWLHSSFGPPKLDNGWDYYGGWLIFTDEKCYNMFLLRWAE